MATVLNFVDTIDPEQRRRPPDIKHEGGWYKVERRIWHKDTVCKNFQEAAAWAYMFGMAEPRPGGRQHKLGGYEFRVEYGQYLTSEMSMAKFFGWSNHKVHRFLERLAMAGRIIVEPVHRSSRGRPGVVQLGCLITICNFGYYQGSQDGPSTERPEVVHRSSDSLRREKEEKKVGSLFDTNTESDSESPNPIHLSSASADPRPAAQDRSTSAQDRSTELLDIWNAELGDLLAKPRKLDHRRKAKLTRRLHEDFNDSADEWRTYCQTIRNSPHLVGENDRGWRADLDWCLEPSHVTRILEGRYAPRHAPAKEPEYGVIGVGCSW